MIPTPSVPDLARVEGSTPEEAAEWLIDFFNSPRVPWSYQLSARVAKVAHQGIHRLDLLLPGCATELNPVGRKSNEEVVSLVAPLAFGRSTHVFNLSPRRFNFGQNRASGFRIPFFFTENKVVKLYYLQPRKKFSLSRRQISMVATIHKRHILDTEFFDLASDLEYIDVSANQENGIREVKRMTLRDLESELWSEEELARRLSLLSTALDLAQSSGRVQLRPRRPVATVDMPLFD